MFGKKKEGSSFSDLNPLRKKTVTEKIADKAKSAAPSFGEPSAFEKCCPKLTFKQRIIGFASCAGLGWLLSLIGTMVLMGGVTAANLNTFVILYVLGNIIVLSGTGFLLGPKKQCTKMWDPTRRIATAVYLIMLIVVLSLAIAKVNIWIVLFALLVEICAAFWYSISFIPFGRKMFIGCMKKTVCKPCADLHAESSGGGGGKG
mmetsp:Transcript_24822/g.42022  ORF Transcript_24822/g.42022 Transcript_24822/m.42022 type:complete len:203 (-) Transcript_24822:348-956(-)